MLIIREQLGSPFVEGFFDSSFCYFVVIFLQFDPDEFASGIDAGDPRGADAHRAVEDDIAGIGVGPHEPLEEPDGLLRRVKRRVWPFELQNAHRVLFRHAFPCVVQVVGD